MQFTNSSLGAMDSAFIIRQSYEVLQKRFYKSLATKRNRPKFKHQVKSKFEKKIFQFNFF